MSYQIANINTLAFTVGTTTTVSWQQLRIPLPIAQQMRPDANAGPVIVVYNESGCQFLATLPVSGQTFTLAAGRWTRKRVPPDEVTMTLQVQQVAGAALYNRVLVDYYTPGEPLEDLGVLGNSPVGGNALTITANQVVNDGLVAPQTIVESTPAASAQTLLMTTDGKFTMAGPFSTDGGAVRTDGSGDFLADLVVKMNLSGSNRRYFVVWAPDGHFWSIQEATDNSFRIVDETSSLSYIFGTSFGLPGGVFTINGQATAGSFGVPVDVSQTFDQHVTTTGLQSLFSFTVPSPGGQYRINLSFSFHNGSNTNISALVVWQDIHAAGSSTAYFMRADTGTLLNALAFLAGGPTGIGTYSMVVNGKTGSTIAVWFNDSAGTPDDFVTATIERLQ